MGNRSRFGRARWWEALEARRRSRLRRMAAAALAVLVLGLLVAPVAAFAQVDPGTAGMALGGSGLGAFVGSFIGSAVGSASAVRRKWDAETRAAVQVQVTEETTRAVERHERAFHSGRVAA